ncbi:MAG: hypothetical protein PCFJNLEI_02016 [Verrucomicrobiae bacterium]|nr:hypothetical protein [Verrucomicrobiae bacterium]
MEIFLLFLVIGLAVWLATRLTRAERTVDELNIQLGRLDREIQQLRRQPEVKPPAPTPPEPSPVPSPAPVVIISQPPPVVEPAPLPVPPPLPPVIAPPRLPPPPPPVVPRAPVIDWEQFMGDKLFAWIGGFVLFLALVFFLKYAFENELFSPTMQVVGEYLLALVLLGGGLWLRKKNVPALAHTLCATSVVALYAVTFAAHAYYRLVEIGPTFGVMTLITAAAFVLAVRLDAQVVALLGLAGGFLTPILLSTGKDNPVGLFTYIALLDIGLLLVALRKRWHYLIALAAFATMVLQRGWVLKFFAPEKLNIALVVLAGFEALFLIGLVLRQRRGEVDRWTATGAAGLALMPLWFAQRLLARYDVTDWTGWFFTFVLLGAVGLLVIAWRARLNFLVAIAAAGTTVLEFAWASRVLQAEQVPTAMAIFLGFDALFVAAFLFAQRQERLDAWVRLTTVGVTFVALIFALYFQRFPSVAAEQPALYFGFLMLADAILALLVVREVSLAPVQVVGGGAVFFVLMQWMTRFFNDALLYWGLGVILLFAVLHAVFPVVLKRLRPETEATRWWQAFPLAAMLLILVPILRMPELSGAIWVCVLLLDVVLFVVAILTATVFAMIGAVALTVMLAGLWIVRMPAHVAVLPEMLWVIGGFAVFFFIMSMVANRRWPKPELGKWQAQLPALGSVLPFLLLLVATGRLTGASATPLFAVALGLVVLLLAVVRLTENDLAGLVALGCSFLFVGVWRQQHFHGELGATVPLMWHLALYGAFSVFPFLFRQQFTKRTLPWAVAALAGPVLFGAIYRLVKVGWPELQPYLGVVPAAFAVPALLGVVIVARGRDECRLSQLAWLGGAALYFVTLIFPIQFHRQWLTIAWALEGAALLWLWHRVPHNGLRWVGGALLSVAFCRLAFNPAVFGYQVRGETPILNWYLYAYGVVTAALFAGGWLVGERRARALFLTLGTVLAFLILNIEIADFFAEPGTAVLTFQFSGNLARDMTYSIAWALFALTMLIAGIVRKVRPARVAALALLSVVVVKLLFHDLANLNQLYRIGAAVGVAVVLLVASFLYQKFVTAGKPPTPPPIP